MTSQWSVALLGADEPLGGEILRLLDERRIPVGPLFPLSLEESDGCVTIMGAEEPLHPAVEFDWAQARIVVSASRSAAAEAFENAAIEAGCKVVCVGAQAQELPGRSVLSGALVTALSRVLCPIDREAGLESVDVAAMLPAAALGQDGVAELVEETRALFAMESREPNLFPIPLAFNLIPQTAVSAETADSALERDVALAMRGLLGRDDLPFSMTAVWAPVFYGASLAVHLATGKVVDLERMHALLAGSDDVVLMNADLAGGVPTPVTDAQESEAVFVGRLRQPGSQAKRLALWLVVDMMRLEAAKIVDLLEKWIEN